MREGNDSMGIRDLFHFIGELKPAILDCNSIHNYPKVTELANKILVPKPNDYSPGGLFSVLSSFGSAGSTIAYSGVATKLQDDLGNIKSLLGNINLILDNPEFAETISV